MTRNEIILTTTETITGKKIAETYGIVRGNSVRAKWFGADIVSALRNIVGGELDQYSNLMNEARERAIQIMKEDAHKIGANAIVGVRFTTSQITQGAAEIMVFGTAVKIK